MKVQATLDVRKLPYWAEMRADVLEIVRAGTQAKTGTAHEASAGMLAAVILKHICIVCDVIGTPETERFVQLMLSIAATDNYPADDDSKLAPASPDDPSAKWDNRRVH